MRTPLYASGSTSFVPYFTTEKLTPQMSAMSSSRKSVSETPGRGCSSARPGAAASRSVDAMTGKVDWHPVRVYVAQMHVSFALFADAANLSQEGKLNILGVFDALQVATLPAVHPRATLVVHLKGAPSDAGSHRVTLHWMSPNGAELWSSDGELGVAAPPN